MSVEPRISFMEILLRCHITAEKLSKVLGDNLEAVYVWLRSDYIPVEIYCSYMRAIKEIIDKMNPEKANRIDRGLLNYISKEVNAINKTNFRNMEDY